MSNELSQKNLIVETVLIVGSILLALTIQEGIDNRQDRILEREVLSAIKSDMEKNLLEIERVNTGHLSIDEALTLTASAACLTE